MSIKSISRRSMLKISAAGSAFLAAQPLVSNPLSRSTWTRDKLNLLIAGLDADDPLIQAQAATLLGQLKTREAVEPLMRYIAECRYFAKSAGFNALMEIRDARALEVVLPLIENPNVPIDRHWRHSVVLQSAAAFTALLLGRGEGREFFEANKDLPRSPDGKLMEWGISTFCIWYAPYILRLPDTGPDMVFMRDLVKSRLARKNHYHPNQVAMVAEGLGILKGPEAVEELKWFLSAFNSRYIRGAAAENLLVADPSASNISLVSGVYANDPADFVKIKAVAGLMAAGNKEHMEFIFHQASHAPDFINRTNAMALLGKYPTDRGNSVLLSNLKHGNPYVRLCAVEALEGWETGAAEVRALATSDPNHRVRLQATKYLLVKEEEV